MEAVQFLAERGAKLRLHDSRGNEPLDDAIRGNKTNVVNYLEKLIAARTNATCSVFENGFFEKGI